MIARTLLALLAALVVATSFALQAAAQPSPSVRRAEEIVRKARQVDLLNQILPVLMTKEQIGKLLPAIERARQAVRQAEDRERSELSALEPKLDLAIKEALEKNLVPGRDILNNAYATFRMIALRREAIAAANVRAVRTVIEEDWNVGQKAAARQALRPEAFDPNVDPEKLTDDQRLDFYVRMILLDPLAYDLLIKLREKAPS